MYDLNIASAIKKMTINELRYFIFESYYKRIGFARENNYKCIGFARENSYYSLLFNETSEEKGFIIVCDKSNKKIPDPSNVKEYHKYI